MQFSGSENSVVQHICHIKVAIKFHRNYRQPRVTYAYVKRQKGTSAKHYHKVLIGKVFPQNGIITLLRVQFEKYAMVIFLLML